MHLTARGFRIEKFTDSNGVECSIQESSAAQDQGLIWLGVEDADPRIFTPSSIPSWNPVDIVKHIPGATDAAYNTRMHLSQSHIKKLLPMLMYFANTGELPDTEHLICDLTDRVVCFSGVLESASRLEWKRYVERQGGRVTASVTSKVDLLVYGPGAGSKLIKAEELGVPTLRESLWGLFHPPKEPH